MAGLWTRETTVEVGKRFYVTIITTAPNGAISKVHNRMPAILTGSVAQQWLGYNEKTLDLLRVYEQPITLEAI